MHYIDIKISTSKSGTVNNQSKLKAFSTFLTFVVSKMIDQNILEHIRPPPTLTLQEMSAIRIITTLCNHRELRSSIFRCSFPHPYKFQLCSRNGKGWRAVRTVANELVSQICKPALLKEKILEHLWPVSYRIILWKSRYASSIRNSLLQHFLWTDRGRIDNARTVRCIIANKNIHVRKRFVLACTVCLENEIKEIWRDISCEDKAHLYADLKNKIYPIVRFWLHTLEGSQYTREPFRSNALICASAIGLLESVIYLFATAPENERFDMPDTIIDELIEKLRSREILEEDDNDMGCFVFPHLTDSRRAYIFSCFLEIPLSLLLHSSKYELCFEILKEKLESGSVAVLKKVLELIFYTYHLEVAHGEDCRFLFMDVWRIIPDWMRETKELRDLRTEFLSVLIRFNFSFLLKKEAFQIIADLTSLDSKSNNYVKQVDFHQGKWNFLHFIIEEVITVKLLKTDKKDVLFWLDKSESNMTAFNRVLRFVRKIQSKNSISKE